MHELANFSIETDQVVLLQFKNGRQRRVSTAQLPQYLPPPDLQRVLAALKLRQNFIKDHMPKIGLIALATGGALALLLGGGHVVAELMAPDRPTTPAPPKDDIARSLAPQGPATPAPSATASPAVTTPVSPAPAELAASNRLAAKKVAAKKPAARLVKAVKKTVDGLTGPVQVVAQAGSGAVADVTLPGAVPTSQVPAPTPTPVPTPPAGQVLGDSTQATPPPSPIVVP